MTRPAAVVVVAASSGSLDPVRKVVANLPPGFPAAIVVANHAPRTRPTRLPTILSTDGPLPAMRAQNLQELEAGRIVIAPHDRQLYLERGPKLRVGRRPSSKAQQPSADLLFQTAAQLFGSRAVGIVLSGRGSDGAAGLAAIRAAGGIAIVQSPEDAQFPALPQSALAKVKPHACVPALEIAATLQQLLHDRLERSQTASKIRTEPRKVPRSASSLRGLRVFVAEDRYLLGAEIIAMLRKLGCTAVGPVPDLLSGEQLFARTAGEIDCAVLDVDLRGKTVFPLAAALRKHGIPVVFATGYGAATLPEQWLVWPRVEKPFDAQALGTAIRTALRAPPVDAPAVSVTFDYNSETLKEVRNLLMVSRAMRDRAGEIEQETAAEIQAAEHSLRTSHMTVEASRTLLNQTKSVVAETRSRNKATKRTLRSWPVGGGTKRKGKKRYSS